MQKNEVLEHLRNAKVAHLKWVQRGKTLVSNIPVEKDAIPMDYTACMFGQWFYSDGQRIAMMAGMDCIGEIGKKHQELHDEYVKIFKIYFGDAHKSFFSKLFNLKKHVSEAEQDIAKEYYNTLKEISEELLKLIDKLERRVSALPQTAFEEI